jgi:hypothetical protein
MPAAAYAEFVHLEKVVVDATDPQALGRFWETARATKDADRRARRVRDPAGGAGTAR